MSLAEKTDARAFDELITALRQWRRWIGCAHHSRARWYFGPRSDDLGRAERDLLDALNAWEAGL